VPDDEVSANREKTAIAEKERPVSARIGWQPAKNKKGKFRARGEKRVFDAQKKDGRTSPAKETLPISADLLLQKTSQKKKKD